jgi:hypothetical protein
MRKRSRRTSAIAAIAIAGLVAGITAIVSGGGTAAATPVSLTLEYSCVFPLIGAQPMTVQINSDIPSEIQVGVPTGAFQIHSVATVNEGARAGLRTVGATTLEGTVKADAHLSVPTLELPLVVDLTIPQAPIPATAGPFDVNANGPTPSLTFTQSQVGTGTITVNDLVLTITPKDANGNPTGLGTFDSQCTLAPGQSNVLHTFQIKGGGGTTTTSTPGSTTSTTRPTTTTSTTRPTTTTTTPQGLHFSFDLAGTSHIQAANGDVPLNGGIEADFNLATGTHSSDLTLNPTSGSFTILGILPTTAAIEFVQVGKTTGALKDGKLTSHSEMFVKLTSVNLFGILPIGGGPDCKTTTPAVIDLATPADEVFNPLQGGRLVGTYTLPPLVAANCGGFGDIISLFTAGPGNTIDMTLTAAS